MSLYLQLVKFTPEGAQALLDHGFEERRSEVARILDENGLGTLKEFWFVADGDYHVASVVENDGSHAYGAHSQLHQTATGSVAAVRSMRIAEGAELAAGPTLDWHAIKAHLS